MKLRFFAIVAVFSAFSLTLSAADETPTHSFGFSLDGAFSHLLMEQPVPGYGGAAGGAFVYELQYKHFLFRSGLGMDYSVCTNRLALTSDVPVVEYPGMTFHYTFDPFREWTAYHTAYVPLYFGGIWRGAYFLAGVKVGTMPFGGRSVPLAHADVWASDDDVLDPMYELPTHGITSQDFVGNEHKLSFRPLNARLSFEFGFNLDKRAWAGENAMQSMSRGARSRKPSVKDRLHYRLSFFADYGEMDLRELPADPAADGCLVEYRTPSDVQLNSIFTYAPTTPRKLNNVLVGVKFTFLCDAPKKASKKSSGAYPYLYAYVTDQLTEKPLGNAQVQIINEKDPKVKLVRATESKLGRVGKALPAGNYSVKVSRNGYFPDSLVFEHGNQNDTVRVALYPQQTLNVVTTDAETGEPIDAYIKLYDEADKLIYEAKLDAAASVLATILDGRKKYYICASADGYIDACDSIRYMREVKNLRLEPIKVRKFVLRNMFFATNQTTILPSSEEALQSLYLMLLENPDLRIRIIGHADDIASDEYNQRLSEGRARSVRQEMIRRGINGKRIETLGRGEKDPIVANDSDEHRQMNRRVEIEILSGVSSNHVIFNEQLKHAAATDY